MRSCTWICWNSAGLLAAKAASFSAMEALRVRTSACTGMTGLNQASEVSSAALCRCSQTEEQRLQHGMLLRYMRCMYVGASGACGS